MSMKMNNSILPVVVVGAGPVGLAAAAHLLSRGLTPVVLEAGREVGASIRQWSHVRMFSPWNYNIDAEAARLLGARGWVAPDPERFPTGGELLERYLQPLAATPELASAIRLDSQVLAISRDQHDLMQDTGREHAPLLVRYRDATGEHDLRAQAVIDASGTWNQPNPLGAAGIPALGERDAGARISYGLVDVLGAPQRYAGQRVLVVGSGHSAFNVLSDLARLRQQAPDTRIHWVVRRPSLRRVLGGGENDQLKERGRLGQHIATLVESGVVNLHPGIRVNRVTRTATGLQVADLGQVLPEVDQIIVATGFRPDLTILSELRLALDPGTQSPVALAPMIDPNQHSCGTVRPHGALELAHPEPGFYIAGIKSYGRAPTFLLLTGYEQVRSISAAIAGDWVSARKVELLLPETGVCSVDFATEEAELAAAGPGGCETGCARPAPVVAVSRCCGSAAAV